METTATKSVEVLNDLIGINNDRVEGFEKAANDLGDGDNDLKSIFVKFSQQSNNNVAELTSEVAKLGGQPESGSGAGGAIHRAWIDVKALFSGHDRKSILEECERGEDAIKKAYRDAIVPESGLDIGLYGLIAKQQLEINAAHDQIKTLRDSEA